jgi:hypothetical protein
LTARTIDQLFARDVNGRDTARGRDRAKVTSKRIALVHSEDPVSDHVCSMVLVIHATSLRLPFLNRRKSHSTIIGR